MRYYRYHEGWHGLGPLLVGWLFPLTLLAALVAVAVWAVRRVTAMPASSAGALAASPQGDQALETARLRYARGEISREDYLLVASDLGAQVSPEPPTPPQP